MLLDFLNEPTAQNGRELAMWVIAIVLSITVHEAAHAYSAYWAGDETPRARGRLSLNPVDHLDPLGTAMLLLGRFGWGKPVEVNPANFRHPRRDDILVSLVGPASNLVLAVVFALVMRVALHLAFRGDAAPDARHITLLEFANTFVMLNLALMAFNLVPIPPLDGSHILAGLLPLRAAQRYERAVGGMVGLLILAAIIVTGVLWKVIGPVIDLLHMLLTGIAM